MIGQEKTVTLRDIVKHFKLEILVDGDFEQNIMANDIHRAGYETRRQ